MNKERNGFIIVERFHGLGGSRVGSVDSSTSLGVGTARRPPNTGTRTVVRTYLLDGPTNLRPEVDYTTSVVYGPFM